MSVSVDPELVNDVRQSIYATIVERGTPPAACEVAAARGVSVAAVEEAYRALAGSHVIVLALETGEIWAAPPFAAPPTAFRVTSGRRAWFAPCAWDSFGIPAAAGVDVEIEAHCAWDRAPLPCGVRNGDVYGEGVLHLLVPASRFWDDISFT